MRIISLLLAAWLPIAAQVAPQVAPMLNLVVVEGEGATNNIRQRTAREPIVQVEDENHKPVAGAVVVFTLPTTGAGGTFANGARTLTMLTDNQGRAVARGFRPTGQGQFQMRVNASHNGQTASANITMTNAAIGAATAGASGISAKLIAIIAVAGGAVAGGAYYATHRGNGTPSAVPVPGTTVTAGGGSVGPPR